MTNTADKKKKSPRVFGCAHEAEAPIVIKEVNGVNRVGEDPKTYAERTMFVCRKCRCVVVPEKPA